jgi:putative hemolysin
MLQAIAPVFAPVFEPAKRAVRHWGSVVSLQQLKHAGYAPKLALRIERENYVIRTVDCAFDLERAFRLRYRVFHGEYGSPPSIFRLDIDSYDFLCDHLVIEDRRSGEIVATYRLICSLFSDVFYTQDEFDLTELLALPGTKLELGRACIDPRYRTGAVMSMLWRGISRYAAETGSRYLFGCSSVKTIDPAEIAALNRGLGERNSRCQGISVLPRGKFRIPGLDRLEATSSTRKAASGLSLPPLLESYLRAGAEVGDEPALDLDFHCADFFTLLRMDRMNPAHERKYRT